MSKRCWKKKDCEKIYINKSLYRDLEFAIEQFFEMQGKRGFDLEDVAKCWAEDSIKKTCEEIQKQYDEFCNEE